MADTIYIRVGTADQIPLKTFVDSLSHFMFVLKDLDASIAKDSSGNMEWDVVSLQKNSPAVVGVAPRIKRGHLDTSRIVEDEFIENVTLLSSRGERTDLLSDSALKRVQSLAAPTKSVGPIEIYLNGNGPVRARANITEITLNNIRGLTSPKYSAFGTIYGSLDSISVHKGNEFRVWNERTRKPVTCKFTEDELDRVKSYLGIRVMVSGTMLSNAAGNPISMAVQELTPSTKRAVPTIEEMSGLIDDFTGGIPLKEYMDQITDE